MIEIYTDGACLINPGGRGGWAFVAYENGVQLHLESGGEAASTNNRMEVMAVVRALQWANGRPCVVYSDSKLAAYGASGKWKKKANQDIWAQLPPGKWTVKWIPRDTHIGNQQADRLAVAAANQQPEGPVYVSLEYCAALLGIKSAHLPKLLHQAGMNPIDGKWDVVEATRRLNHLNHQVRDLGESKRARRSA